MTNSDNATPGSHGYIVCGKPSLLSAAVDSVCQLFGLHASARQTTAAARLVLLDHSSVTDPIAARDIEFFRFSLGGWQKNVLRIHEAGSSTNQPPAWLFETPVSSPRCIDMLEWIASVPGRDGTRISPPPDVTACQNLIAGALDTSSCGDLGAILGKSWPFKVSIAELASAPSTPDLYDSLLRLSADYLVYDHEIGKVLAHPFEHKGELPGALLAHRLREVCEDLRLSLLDRLVSPAHGKPSGILFIDDKPGDFDGLLELLQASLLRGFSCFQWNPDRIAFQALCTYRSIEHIPITGLEINVRSLSPQNQRWTDATYLLTDLLPQLQFIVIDQLYRWGQRAELRGHELIRGLSRVLRDHGAEEQHHIPEIIALSHTRSPHVINQALRAGARDYVEKSHLIGLPAVLARIQRTVSEPTASPQRNFSLLYRLPNEVIGYLRTAVIPWDKIGESIQDDEATQRVHALLSAIPKTDLHVHVGSCMSTEFLVLASLIGLLQHEKLTADHWSAVKSFADAIVSTRIVFSVQLIRKGLSFAVAFKGGFKGDHDWISDLASATRYGLSNLLTDLYAKRDDPERALDYRALRSVLHAELRVSDYKSDREAHSALEGGVTNLNLAWFAVRHREGIADSALLDNDTLVRLYLLVLAANKYDGAKLTVGNNSTQDILGWFRQKANQVDSDELWGTLRADFYGDTGNYTVAAFRRTAWREPYSRLPAIRLALPRSSDDKAIEWTLGTGTRSHSLVEYLQGCEFSGATHLKHPFLIHLYAQQLMPRFVRLGLMYAELRGSPDGYVNRDIGFGFADACDCTVAALTLAQEAVVAAYDAAVRIRKSSGESTWDTMWLPEILGEDSSKDSEWSYEAWRAQFKANGSALSRRFPVKTSIILVGKRHKAVTDMMLEAAAGAVLYQFDSRFQALGASEFAEECRRCRVVGFDLAGNEADFPPDLFSTEFQRLSKLKVPITVHAGENASSRFVEDAILELRAKRIGHALSLADDKKLMALVRDERICVELCPVSNHQTSHFTPKDQPGRTYPLGEFLSIGIPVCINTDNPIISRTDIIKEYFKASSAMEGLSLWGALRLVKTGFVHAFLPLPVRRAMLEVVDQILFDLFSDPAAQAHLRELVELQATEPRGRQGADGFDDAATDTYDYPAIAARWGSGAKHFRWRIC